MIRLKVRKNDRASAWNRQIGSLKFYSGWKRVSIHHLIVGAEVDAALMVISTICLVSKSNEGREKIVGLVDFPGSR